MILVGIDYSLSCPCICVGDTNNQIQFNQCQFHFLTDKPKYSQHIKNNIIDCEGMLHSNYFGDNIQRYDYISEWALNIIKSYQDKSRTIITTIDEPIQINVTIEELAYSQLGRISVLAENVGLLKYKLYKNNISFKLIGPTVHRKNFMSGFNVKNIKDSKQKMYYVFQEKYNINLKDIFPSKSKQIGSPISDIIDAYSLILCAHKNIIDNIS